MWKVSGHFMQVVLQCAERRGLARDKILAAMGLPVSLMDSSIHSVTDQEFFRLWQYLVDVLQDEFLALTGKPSRPGSFETYHGKVCGAVGKGLDGVGGDSNP